MNAAPSTSGTERLSRPTLGTTQAKSTTHPKLPCLNASGRMTKVAVNFCFVFCFLLKLCSVAGRAHGTGVWQLANSLQQWSASFFEAK